MSSATALITGITGQDGSYVADFLLATGNRVVGMVRRASTENSERIERLRGCRRACRPRVEGPRRGGPGPRAAGGVDVLLDDATKAHRALGWRPTVSFAGLVEMTVDADLERYRVRGNGE